MVPLLLPHTLLALVDLEVHILLEALSLADLLVVLISFLNLVIE